MLDEEQGVIQQLADVVEVEILVITVDKMLQPAEADEEEAVVVQLVLSEQGLAEWLLLDTNQTEAIE